MEGRSYATNQWEQINEKRKRKRETGWRGREETEGEIGGGGGGGLDERRRDLEREKKGNPLKVVRATPQ